MTSVESYKCTSAESLRGHLAAVDAQCSAALEYYKALITQRDLVVQALGDVLSQSPESVTLELILVQAA